MERRRLDQGADATEVVGGPLDRMAEHGGRPAARTDEPEQHRHQRGLAGTVGADQTGDGAAGHGEREVVDRHPVAEALREAVDGDGVVCRVHVTTVRSRRCAVVGAAWRSAYVRC